KPGPGLHDEQGRQAIARRADPRALPRARDIERDDPAPQARRGHGRAPQASAIAAIDTFSPGTRTGSFAPWRAGGLDGNHFSHSSFMPAKSSSSASTIVALTTLSSELPAASRIAEMFVR